MSQGLASCLCLPIGKAVEAPGTPLRYAVGYLVSAIGSNNLVVTTYEVLPDGVRSVVGQEAPLLTGFDDITTVVTGTPTVVCTKLILDSTQRCSEVDSRTAQDEGTAILIVVKQLVAVSHCCRSGTGLKVCQVL